MKHLLLIITLLVTSPVYAQTVAGITSYPSRYKDKSSEKKSFVDKLPQPIRWIIRNWADFDPDYSLPAFYSWAFHLQNTTSCEWIDIETPQGVQLNMRSRVSNRIGPYFGWRFLFFGTTIDLSALGKGADKRKDEFTLSINSNLFNIDLIRRRTGSDFTMRKLNYTDPVYGTFDLKNELNLNRLDLGDYTKNSLTGININYFVNHRKYSNPAAFTQGAIQLRSVGSPIVGLGYTRQKVETESASLFGTLGLGLLNEANDGKLFDESKLKELEQLYDNNPAAYDTELKKILQAGWPKLSEIEAGNSVRNVLTNRIPTTTTIDDWHIQLGYAYNLVFSRRLLFGISAILSPGLKRVRSDNDRSYIAEKAEIFRDIIRDVEGRDVPLEDFRYHFKDTYLNLNGFLRASLTYNHNRWRAGFNASYSNYFYKHKGTKVNNRFGNITFYVGYCFGRRKDYRHGGELREGYITTALTPRQIEEMRDTMPNSNIDLGPTYAVGLDKKTNYHTDKVDIDVNGCDLVIGPEGKYGWFEIEDGYVTPLQDTEGRLKKGTVLEIDKNGSFDIEAGHKATFRAANWWKSRIDAKQTTNHWYPELLHYALCGKLTLYLRGSLFGTDEPVKLVIDGFYVNHGNEARSFYQVGVKSFTSNMANIIEGTTMINGCSYRVNIEKKKHGKSARIILVK